MYVLEPYLVFTCCWTNASVSASTRKDIYFDPCACVYGCVKAIFTVKKGIIVLALVLPLPMKTKITVRCVN